MFTRLSPDTLIIRPAGLELPPNPAAVIDVDFKKKKIKSPDWALASLAVLAGEKTVLSAQMLDSALKLRFNTTVYTAAAAVLERAVA
jgi:hypothetical protein